MFDNWWVVTVATKGPVAAFQDRESAEDHANALRDIIGEARGMTSAFSVVQNKVWHFRYYTKDHGAIVATVTGTSEKSAQGASWAQLLRKYPDAIYVRHELLT